MNVRRKESQHKETKRDSDSKRKKETDRQAQAEVKSLVPPDALDCRSAWMRMSVGFIRKLGGKGKKVVLEWGDGSS